MSEPVSERRQTPQGTGASPEGLQQLERQITEPQVEEAPVPSHRGVVLCIPALNAEKRIGKIVSKALRFVNKVLVCDDASLDETASRAREAGAFVIEHKEGTGISRSISDLMEQAAKSDPQVVVTMDLDKHNDPEQIPDLVEPIRKDEADICIGIHEEAGAPVAGPQLLALSSKALAARSKDDFFTSMGSDEQMAVAIASGLRVKLVTFKAAPLAPPVVARPKGGVPLQERWDSFMRRIIIERPFFFIGAPGIELSVAGLALVVIALLSYNSGAKLNIPLLVVGEVVLLFGLVFIMSFSVIYAVENRGRAQPQKQEKPSSEQ